MTRYKILDELLSNRHHNYSLDELTEEINKRLSELYPDINGVVRRTIEKDIYYLEYEGPFFAEIERYTVSGYNYDKQKAYSKKCLRYANPAFSIFKQELTADEKTLLRETLSIIGQFDGLPNFDALERLRLGLGAKSSAPRIISFSKNPIENTNLLGEIFTAISEKQVIKIDYHKFSNLQETREINLFPYLLKEYNRRWYLIAAAESDGKLLNFSLDRIDSIYTLPSHNYVEYDGDINERFEDIIGVTVIEDSPVYKIVFWVSNQSKEYVSTKPLHESQRVIKGATETRLRNTNPLLFEGRFFMIECKYNYELLRELTSFGEDLIVVEPADVRTKVVKRIHDMYQRYCF